MALGSVQNGENQKGKRTIAFVGLKVLAPEASQGWGLWLAALAAASTCSDSHLLSVTQGWSLVNAKAPPFYSSSPTHSFNRAEGCLTDDNATGAGHCAKLSVCLEM